MLKRLMKYTCIGLVGLALVGGTAVPAFAAINHGTPHYAYMEPSLTYMYRNGYAYLPMGYYFADCESWMWVKNQGRSVGAGAIMSQAGMTVWDVIATPHVKWGPAVTNSKDNPDGVAVESYLYYCMNAPDGAVAWGYGVVRRPDSTYLEIGTEENFLGSLGSWGTYSAKRAIAEKSDGLVFVGNDGLTYGVPFKDDAGMLCMPDMVRVKLNEDSYGYICYDELVDAAFNGALSEEEIDAEISAIDRQKAEAIEDAIDGYFGCDLVDKGDAQNLVGVLALQNGRENMRIKLENIVAPTLAQRVNAGELSNDVAAIILGESLESKGYVLDGASVVSAGRLVPSRAALEYIKAGGLDAINPDDISISDDLVEEIISIAKPLVAYDIPVYDENAALLGTYSIDRI